MKIPDLPEDIIKKILEDRTEIMKEIRLENIEYKAYNNYLDCIDELEQNIEESIMYIDNEIEEYGDDIDEAYYHELYYNNFSLLLLETTIDNTNLSY